MFAAADPPLPNPLKLRLKQWQVIACMFICIIQPEICIHIAPHSLALSLFLLSPCSHALTLFSCSHFVLLLSLYSLALTLHLVLFISPCSLTLTSFSCSHLVLLLSPCSLACTSFSCYHLAHLLSTCSLTPHSLTRTSFSCHMTYIVTQSNSHFLWQNIMKSQKVNLVPDTLNFPVKIGYST